jgi:hypothetical protein
MDVIDIAGIGRARRAFSTRRAPEALLRRVSTEGPAPRAGDLVLARVAALGRLRELELASGRRARLYPGDPVVVAYGARYAPDAYEAAVPGDLGPCALAAAGGLAAEVLTANALFAAREPQATRLEPVGRLVSAEGAPLNLADFGLAPAAIRPRAPVIAVVGASMNSGKTTTVAGIVRGLTAKGLRVAAAKVTGTCAGGDLWKFLDAGAIRALDFTDAGMATTYLADHAAVRAGAETLIATLDALAPDAIVIEIADGLHQRETAALIADPGFTGQIATWLFAADGACGAILGARRLTELGLDVAALSGAFSVSPLAAREAAAHVATPVVTLPELEDGAVAVGWLGARAPRPAVVGGGR